MSDESELVQSGQPCPCGKSSDAFSFYDDGHGYCFSGKCEQPRPYFSQKQLAEVGLADEPDDSVVPRGDRVSAKSSPLLRGSPQALAKRGITEETCKKWGYIRAEFNGRNVHVAQYKDENGRVVSQKIRLPNKDFVWRGPAKEAPSLYGKWLWKSGGKKIIVTEGEIDALTVSQLQGNKWPVVSVKDGAGSAPKAIRSELQYLNSFDEVILMFDMDEPGQDAVEKCVGLFPPGKCYVASLPHKDANECLLKGEGKEVINAIWNAKEYRPDSIINPAEMWDDFISVDEASSIPYPFDGLNVKTMGLRQRELTTITAGSGIGKSSLCREIAHWIVSTQGQKLGYIALEESWKKTMQELVGIEMNTRLIKADPEEVDQKELKDAYSTLTGSGNLYLYNHFGSLNSERLLDHIRYMASGLGVGWVVLDHLSIVVSGDDGIGDERRAIDVAMTKLRSLVEETGIGLILVSHLKRPDGKGHEEGAVTSLAQLRGSAAIAQLSDMVLGLERNQQDPENADRTQIRVLKNRFTGETGEACGLVYDHQTGRLSEDTLFEDESGDTDSEY